MTLNLQTSEVYCPRCGYVRPDEISRLGGKRAEVEARGEPPAVQLAQRGAVLPAALAAFDSGQAALFQDDRQAAIRHFQRSAEFQPDFVDAHFWLAELADDPAIKREHLNTVLSLMPNHLEAARRLMVLDGRMTPEQMARSYGETPAPVHGLEPLTTRTEIILCPSCGGALEIDEHAEQVRCRFCGQVTLRAKYGSVADRSLVLALLERRSTPTFWQPGKRVFHCQQCGAEETVSGDTLADHCRFCGSPRVNLADAGRSFQPPDGVLPFAMDKSTAWREVQRELKGFTEWVRGLFDENRIESTRFEGAYLPFWVFDVVAEITHTRTTALAVDSGTTRTTSHDMLTDIAVSAARSPSPLLLNRLLPYDMRAVQPFETAWLAEHPAQVYALDVDKASYDAREFAADRLRLRHNREIRAQNGSRSSDSQVDITRVAYSGIKSMSFRLVLLPVWIGTLYEADGDVRTVLVNGQTGKVVFGGTHKRQP
jgi:predicted RNA-binding Zn-ribbon protein involved in translation (DUF1610 family)